MREVLSRVIDRRFNPTMRARSIVAGRGLPNATVAVLRVLTFLLPFCLCLGMTGRVHSAIYPPPQAPLYLGRAAPRPLRAAPERGRAAGFVGDPTKAQRREPEGCKRGLSATGHWRVRWPHWTIGRAPWPIARRLQVARASGRPQCNYRSDRKTRRRFFVRRLWLCAERGNPAWKVTVLRDFAG